MTAHEIDEVLGFLVLAVHAQSELRVELSTTISCAADASPYGGGSAVAQKFKEKSLQVREPVVCAREMWREMLLGLLYDGPCGRQLLEGRFLCAKIWRKVQWT